MAPQPDPAARREHGAPPRPDGRTCHDLHAHSGRVTRGLRARRPRAASAAPRRSAVVGPPPFDGYPYLVTRIGRTALRHFAVVPAEWPRDRLVDLLRRQADANQLETCLCLGPADAVYVRPPGQPAAGDAHPDGHPDPRAARDRRPAAGLAGSRPASRPARRVRGAPTGDGYLVGDGLEGGTPATPEDVARLSGTGPDGLPRGLRRCGSCRQPRGEHLSLRGLDYDERNPRVVRVRCQCDNHNRCAGCGGTLDDQRLSAWSWIEEAAAVLYVAAYCGLSHRCPVGLRPRRAELEWRPLPLSDRLLSRQPSMMRTAREPRGEREPPPPPQRQLGCGTYQERPRVPARRRRGNRPGVPPGTVPRPGPIGDMG